MVCPFFPIATMSEERSERSDGRIVKMEVDYSSTVDERLPECEKMAKVSELLKEGQRWLSHGASRSVR